MKNIMKITTKLTAFLLSSLFTTWLIFQPATVEASATFDCFNKKFEIQLAMDYDGSFFSGRIYEETGPNSHQEYDVSKEKLQKSAFSWERQSIHLKSNQNPSFELKAHGRNGFLKIHGIRWPIACDWER